MTRPPVRHDWTREEVRELFKLPFLELARVAQTVHATHQDPDGVQLCTLSNIKSGGCPENCAYCPQSAHHSGAIPSEPLSELDDVLDQATRAKAAGATRFCMGAAWRQVRDGAQFDRVLSMVEGVASMGMEVCVTLGMLDVSQAKRLRDAGLTAYNHNIDTGPEFYDEIITTHSLSDRLSTISAVRDAGITVCCGGIVGLGETENDRVEMLHLLATMNPHPESVPINKLVRIPGTPLAEQDEVKTLDFLRTIAVARILMPRSMVRLAAGRSSLSPEARVLAFMLGANSIFYGEHLLTTPNPEVDEDQALLRELGLHPLPARPLAPQPS